MKKELIEKFIDHWNRVLTHKVWPYSMEEIVWEETSLWNPYYRYLNIIYSVPDNMVITDEERRLEKIYVEPIRKTLAQDMIDALKNLLTKKGGEE